MSQVINVKNDGYQFIDDERAVSFDSKDMSEIASKLDLQKPVTINIDSQEFYLRKALLPTIGKEKIKDILPIEMEGMFLASAKELYFEILFLENKGEKDEYLVFALKKELLHSILIPLLNKGVEICGVFISNIEAIRDFAKNLDPDSLKMLNFYPDDMKRYDKKRFVFSAAKKVIIYAILIFLIMILGISLRLYLLTKKEVNLKKEIAAQYNVIFPEAKTASLTPTVIMAKLKELNQNYRLLKGFDLLEILKNLSVNRGELVVKEVSIDSSKIIIKGEAKEYSYVENYKSSIKKSFPTVKIIETKKLSDGKTLFIMETTNVE